MLQRVAEFIRKLVRLTFQGEQFQVILLQMEPVYTMIIKILLLPIQEAIAVLLLQGILPAEMAEEYILHRLIEQHLLQVVM